MYVAHLDAEKHAVTINENWKYKNETSLGLVRQSIEFNGGLGLFRRGESQPLCWMLENEFLSPGYDSIIENLNFLLWKKITNFCIFRFLYTMPSERRKGYGALIMKLELKRLLKLHNLDLFTFVVVHNERSMQLHRKLGFEIATRIVWFKKPH